MRALVVGAAVAALCCGGIARAAPPDAPAQSASTGEAKKQFDALLAEVNKAFREARESNGPFKLEEWIPKFKAIADKYPKDPGAANALVFIVQNSPNPGDSAPALEQLAANHLGNPAIIGVFPVLAQAKGSAKSEAYLRQAMEKSSNRDVQGHATMALGPLLSASGKPEGEKLLETVTTKYADVKAGRGTLGDQAKGLLNEARNLGIGKTAPEITGTDVNGKPLKLSDYRGKVVLLDFWGHW